MKIWIAGLVYKCLGSSAGIPVPVGQSHHDVKRGQEEHEVEERVAVRDAILLVVYGPV